MPASPQSPQTPSSSRTTQDEFSSWIGAIVLASSVILVLIILGCIVGRCLFQKSAEAVFTTGKEPQPEPEDDTSTPLVSQINMVRLEGEDGLVSAMEEGGGAARLFKAPPRRGKPLKSHISADIDDPPSSFRNVISMGTAAEQKARRLVQQYLSDGSSLGTGYSSSVGLGTPRYTSSSDSPSPDTQMMVHGIRDFDVQEQLGNGVHGVVYAARPVNGVGTVALKMWHSTHALSSQEREVRLWAELRHPNLIRYHGLVYVEDKIVGVSMERAEAGDLRVLLEKQGSQDIVTVARWMHQLASGLQYLHQKQLLHRDIKPENIFLSRNPKQQKSEQESEDDSEEGAKQARGKGANADYIIKLGDFGSLRYLNPSMARTILGTPGYLAPEVARGETYSYAADCYSLGVVIYELIAGERPSRSSFNPTATCAAMPLPLESPVRQLVEKLLSAKPSERPSTEHIVRELGTLLATVDTDTHFQSLPPPRSPACPSDGASKAIHSLP